MDRHQIKDEFVRNETKDISDQIYSGYFRVKFVKFGHASEERHAANVRSVWSVAMAARLWVLQRNHGSL